MCIRDRRRIPCAVRTSATRTMESWPAKTLVITPRFHWSGGGELSSKMRTSCPMFKFLKVVRRLLRCCNWCKWSLDHRFQMDCVNLWSSCHLPKRLVLTRVQSGSGSAVSGEPTRKWAGVKGSGSLKSLDIENKGRESVSYTHLDVYKRQSIYCLAKGLFMFVSSRDNMVRGMAVWKSFVL